MLPGGFGVPCFDGHAWHGFPGCCLLDTTLVAGSRQVPVRCACCLPACAQREVPDGGAHDFQIPPRPALGGALLLPLQFTNRTKQKKRIRLNTLPTTVIHSPASSVASPSRLILLQSIPFQLSALRLTPPCLSLVSFLSFLQFIRGFRVGSNWVFALAPETWEVVAHSQAEG